MRKIPKKNLLPMSSSELRALLMYDLSLPKDERLSTDTIEHIHDIAAERDEEGDDEDTLNLLQDVALVLATA